MKTLSLGESVKEESVSEDIKLTGVYNLSTLH